MRSLLSKFRKSFETKSQDEQQKKVTDNHLRSIFTFKKQKESQEVIENIEELDLFGDYGDDKLVGRLKKRFVRLHKGYFPRFPDDIKAGYPNCHYVTYLNDRHVATTGQLPENLYVLMKEMPASATLDCDVERNQMYAELVSPQFLNYFGCDTVYNESLVQDGKYNILSLYFIKPNNRFYLSLNINPDANISDLAKMQTNLDAIDEKLDILSEILINEEQRKKPKIDRKKIKEDFIYSYLVRSLLLGDRDFKERNYGFMLDKDNNVVYSAPNFDLEFCFSRMAKQTMNVNENLEFIYKNYPHVLNHFLRNLENITKKQENGKPKYKEIFESVVQDKIKAEDFAYVFESNAAFIQQKIIELKKNMSWAW